MAKQLIKGYEKEVPVVVIMRKIYEFDNGIEIDDNDKMSEVFDDDHLLLHATKITHQIKGTNLRVTLMEKGDTDNKSVSSLDAADLFTEVDRIIEEHAENCTCYLQECCNAIRGEEDEDHDDCCGGECSTWHNIAKLNDGTERIYSYNVILSEVDKDDNETVLEDSGTIYLPKYSNVLEYSFRNLEVQNWINPEFADNINVVANLTSNIFHIVCDINALVCNYLRFSTPNKNSKIC